MTDMQMEYGGEGKLHRTNNTKHSALSKTERDVREGRVSKGWTDGRTNGLWS